MGLHYSVVQHTEVHHTQVQHTQVQHAATGCTRHSVVQPFSVCCSVLQCVATAALPYAMYGILRYGVATISRLLQIMGLFCKRAL